ncbi:8091_t:CDS:1, partial [Racocetra persica]
MSLYEEVPLYDYANEISESSSRIYKKVSLHDYANEVSESSSRVYENDSSELSESAKRPPKK